VLVRLVAENGDCVVDPDADNGVVAAEESPFRVGVAGICTRSSGALGLGALGVQGLVGGGSMVPMGFEVLGEIEGASGMSESSLLAGGAWADGRWSSVSLRIGSLGSVGR
jgi:hypothetical protein